MPDGHRSLTTAAEKGIAFSLENLYACGMGMGDMGGC